MTFLDDEFIICYGVIISSQIMTQTLVNTDDVAMVLQVPV